VEAISTPSCSASATVARITATLALCGDLKALLGPASVG